MELYAKEAMEEFLAQARENRRASRGPRRMSACSGEGGLGLGLSLRRSRIADGVGSVSLGSGFPPSSEPPWRPALATPRFEQEFLRRLSELQTFVLANMAASPGASPTARASQGPGAQAEQPHNVAFKSGISVEEPVEVDLGGQSVELAPTPTEVMGTEDTYTVSASAGGLRSQYKNQMNTASFCSNTDRSSLPSVNGNSAMKLRRQTTAQNVVDTLSSVKRSSRPSAGYFRYLSRLALAVIEGISSIVVVLNAIVIGLSSDLNPGWHGWDQIDIAFAAAFLLEMLLKMVIQQRDYVYGREKYWNLFEACLVALSTAEVVVVLANGQSGGAGWGLLRMLRLARITRLLRICRLQVFTELMIMVQGALGGVRTLCWATVLMFFPLYGAAIVFRETLGMEHAEGYGAERFASLPLSLYTLFRCVVSSECTDPSGRPIFSMVGEHHGWGYSFLYCMLELAMSFGLFNVIVGIFIENVLAGARHNDMLVQRERLRDQSFFAERMAELAKHLYTSQRSIDGLDTAVPPVDELMEICSEMRFTSEAVDEAFSLPEVRELFEALNIAEEDTVNIYRVLDIEGSGSIDMATLFDGIAHLRGSPCKSDLVLLSFVIERMEEALNNHLRSSQALYGVLETVSGSGQQSVLVAPEAANAVARVASTAAAPATATHEEHRHRLVAESGAVSTSAMELASCGSNEDIRI